MPGASSYSVQAFLAWMAGKTAMPALPTIYGALFTATGSNNGTGFTEVSGGGYARIAIPGTSWGIPSGVQPSTIANTSVVNFPGSTGSWGTVIAWGLYDALTGGDLINWDFLGNFNWAPFTCTSASPGIITSPAHGYSAADKVVVTTDYGGTLPATSGSWLGLLTVGSSPTTDTFNVGLNTTSTGDGSVRKVAAQAVPAGQIPSFAVGSLILVTS